MTTAHFILYVVDQQRSMEFYESVLGTAPRLHVKGMTEFAIGDAVLGLMPETSVSRLLGVQMADLAAGRSAIRAEVYLLVDEPAECHAKALAAGAREISQLSERDWGHEAAYSFDLDGHVLAFARSLDGN